MSLDNWNDYTGSSWLKPDDIDSEDKAYAVVNVDESEEDNRPVLTLERDGQSCKFSLNVTNAIKCKEYVDSPKKLIGKKIYFNKSKAWSPNAKKEVDTLRIYNVV